MIMHYNIVLQALTEVVSIDRKRLKLTKRVSQFLSLTKKALLKVEIVDIS